MHVKDWVAPLLRTWGNEKKRSMRGCRRFGDGFVEEDGWPAISVAAFASQGGITGGSGASSQHYEEVYSRDGLMVWRIYQDSPVEIQHVAFAHFVAGGSIRSKAHELGLSVAYYWRRLDCAYYYFAGRIHRVDSTQKIPT